MSKRTPSEYHPPLSKMIHDEREWAHKTNMLRRQKRVPVTLARVAGVDYSRLDGKPLTPRHEP